MSRALERAATAEAAGEEETAKGAEAISGAAVERDQGGGVAGAVRSGVWRSIEEMEGSSGGGGGGERVDGDGLGVSVTTAAAEDGVELGWTGFA